jgi:anti-anti-sigma factor
MTHPPIEDSYHGSDLAIVTLLGEHDLSTKAELSVQLEQLVRTGERVIVDLSEAEYVGSAVVETLVRVDAPARQRGLRLTLQVGRAATVDRVVEVTGLRELLPIADSRQEAIRLARSSV